MFSSPPTDLEQLVLPTLPLPPIHLLLLLLMAGSGAPDSLMSRVISTAGLWVSGGVLWSWVSWQQWFEVLLLINAVFASAALGFGKDRGAQIPVKSNPPWESFPYCSPGTVWGAEPPKNPQSQGLELS